MVQCALKQYWQFPNESLFSLLSVWLLKFFFPPIQSVLGKMNEIAKHKAAIEDADTQNKVSNHSMLMLMRAEKFLFKVV